MKRILTILILIIGTVSMDGTALAQTIPGCTTSECTVENTGTQGGNQYCGRVENATYEACCIDSNINGGVCNEYCDLTADPRCPGAVQLREMCATVGASNYEACCVKSSLGGSACNEYCDATDDPQCTENIPGLPKTGGGNGNGTVNGTASNTSTGVTSASNPAIAACSAIKFTSFIDYLIWLKCIIGAAIVPLIFTLAFLFFLWGITRFMMTTDATKREEAKKVIYWGLIGLFVMVAVWGIIKQAGALLGVDSAVPFLQTEYLKK
jgi:hypothetical protein